MRRRDSKFAQRWSEALDRARQSRVARKQSADARHDGWNEARKTRFLDILAQTGTVSDACAQAAISPNSAYALRNRSPEFATAWDRALRQARPTIRRAAFARAVEGWDEIVYRDGVEVSRRRRYSDSLLRLLFLHAAEKKQRKRAEALARKKDKRNRVATQEETDKSILRKLDALDRREQQKRAEANAAEWARWQQCWGLSAGVDTEQAPLLAVEEDEASPGPRLRMM